jgi:GxxExxY protein
LRPDRSRGFAQELCSGTGPLPGFLTILVCAVSVPWRHEGATPRGQLDDGDKTMLAEDLTGRIIGCAMRVHSVLGPGLLESAYKVCLIHELKRSGLEVKKEIPLRLKYDEVILDAGYRLDILVEDTVVVEVKAVSALAQIHKAQLISYLRLGGFPIGLLINFNVVHLSDGVKRVYSRASQRGSNP